MCEHDARHTPTLSTPRAMRKVTQPQNAKIFALCPNACMQAVRRCEMHTGTCVLCKQAEPTCIGCANVCTLHIHGAYFMHTYQTPIHRSLQNFHFLDFLHNSIKSSSFGNTQPCCVNSSCVC